MKTTLRTISKTTHEAQVQAQLIQVMTKCLEEQMAKSKLDDACRYWNEKVKKEADRDIGLKIIFIRPSSGGDLFDKVSRKGFIVNIEVSNTPGNKKSYKSFYVLYAPSISEAHAVLATTEENPKPTLTGLNARDIVKTMAIFTRGKIHGVLDHDIKDHYREQK